jgi:hypothetical protein
MVNTTSESQHLTDKELSEIAAALIGSTLHTFTVMVQTMLFSMLYN